MNLLHFLLKSPSTFEFPGLFLFCLFIKLIAVCLIILVPVSTLHFSPAVLGGPSPSWTFSSKERQIYTKAAFALMSKL